MESTREIEKLFYQDASQKKRIGANIFRRVSTRRGGSNMSSMKVPTKKQMREWSGDVVEYNLNTILNVDDFEKLTDSDKKLYLEFWRKEYKTVDIIEQMGINKNEFYRLLKRLDIKKAERRPLNKRTKDENIVPDRVLHNENVHEEVDNHDTLFKYSEVEQSKQHEAHITTVIDSSENTFEFSLKGEYDSKTLVRRLELLINEIENSDEKLNIELVVRS